MPKVDFYLIKENFVSANIQFICRLLEKAYQQKQAVYVHTNNEIEAQTLDDQLWTFKEDSFIPHCLINHSYANSSPILIGFGQAPNEQKNILINLTVDVLPFYKQFNRIIEIVPNEAQSKEICRQKFRSYKLDNCELMTHDLTKN